MKFTIIDFHVAIYIRVSTMDQVEGYSLDVQRERLTAYCTAQGWNNVTVYMDDGESGTNMERPGLKRMIRHIEEKKIHAVVVLKLDRLSRKQKDVLYLLEEVFEKNGVVFKSATEPFDTSTPLGKAMIGVLAVFAQLERDMIIERTTTGKRQRVSEGKWGGGNVTMGYVYNPDTDTLDIVEEEAEIIREIFRKYIDGESRESIAEWASKRTPKFVNNSTIKMFITRVTYVGRQQHGNEVFDGNHEPIIDEVTWNAAQKEYNRRKDGLSPKGVYLLTGLLKCGMCGGPVIQSNVTRKKPHATYTYDYCACATQQVKRKNVTEKCTLGFHRRNVIEKFVIDSIKNINETAKLTHESQTARQEVTYDGRREAVESRLKDVNRGMENLYEAIQEGVVKASAVAGRIMQLQKEKDALDQQLEDIKDSDRPVTVNYEEIQMVGDAWDYMTEEEQKTILRKVILQIVLNPVGTPHEIIWNV